MPADTPKRSSNELSPLDNQPLHKKPIGQNMEIGKLSVDEFRLLLDAKFDNLATKADLKNEIAEMKEQCDELRKQVTKLTMRESEMPDQINRLENNARKKNLIFRGIKIINEQSALETVKQFCKELLGIDIEPDHAYRVGSLAFVIAEMKSMDEVRLVLSNCNKLKGTNIQVSGDYSKSTRIKRGVLFKLYKQLQSINGNIRMVVKNDALLVDNKQMKLNNTMDLIHNSDDAIPILNNIFGQ